MKRRHRAIHPWLWLGVTVAAGVLLAWAIVDRPKAVPVRAGAATETRP